MMHGVGGTNGRRSDGNYDIDGKSDMFFTGRFRILIIIRIRILIFLKIGSEFGFSSGSLIAANNLFGANGYH